MPLFSVGLDLGQANDYSALAVIEHVKIANRGYLAAEAEAGILSGKVDASVHHNVLALKRWPLGTSYTQVVDEVAAILRRPDLHEDGHFLFDATGVGRAVKDLFWEKFRRRELCRRIYKAVTITVQIKKDLADSVLVPMQQGRLHIAPGQLFGEVVERELVSYRQKISASGNTSYDTTEKDGHGDLATAVMLAMLYSGGYNRARIADPNDYVSVGA